MIIEFEGHHINTGYIVSVTPILRDTTATGTVKDRLYFELHCVGNKVQFEKWTTGSDDSAKVWVYLNEQREKLLSLWKQELQRQGKAPFKNDVQNYDKYEL